MEIDDVFEARITSGWQSRLVERQGAAAHHTGAHRLSFPVTAGTAGVIGLGEGAGATGVTVVLTTHYLEEAEALCDTIAIVNRGEVVACEPTSQLLRRIDTRTVVITPQEPLNAVPDLGRFEGRIRAGGVNARLWVDRVKIRGLGKDEEPRSYADWI